MLTKRVTLLLIFATLMVLVLPASGQGNRIILDNNSGPTSQVFFIEGEPTLVMNGFDLTPTSLQLPVIIENINIDVFEFVANELIDVVVYEDPNGGSPRDATLIAQQQFVIDRNGVFVVNFDQPIVTNSPVIWIGFYLPVGFRFRVDEQGPRVLTYWAWTPGQRFNLRNLNDAQVFGPADGSAPVNINQNGIARIRAEAFSTNQVDIVRFPASDEQIDNADLSVLLNYAGCPTLFKDETDVAVSFENSISIQCREVESWNAPRPPDGFTRRTTIRGVVYDITIYDNSGNVITGTIDPPVTHCVAPALDEQPVAVIGIAYGSPRRWQLLPSQQFNNLVCAEINRGGGISYFTPNE